VPVVVVAAYMLLGRATPALQGPAPRRLPRVLPAALLLVLVVTVAGDAVVWWRIHTEPDTGYVQFLAWADTALPPGGTLATTEETAQFVLDHVHVGRWQTGQELRANRADHVLVVSELVRQGYSAVDPEYRDIIGTGKVVFRADSRSLGTFTVYDVSAVIP
jgi:hypothetical protein